MASICWNKNVSGGLFAKRFEVAADKRGINRITPGQNENRSYNRTGR